MPVQQRPIVIVLFIVFYLLLLLGSDAKVKGCVFLYCSFLVDSVLGKRGLIKKLRASSLVL